MQGRARLLYPFRPQRGTRRFGATSASGCGRWCCWEPWRWGFTLWLGLRRSTSRERRVMIAVLPLQDLSAPATGGYLSSGLTEEIITRLAQLEQIGRASCRERV